MFRKRIREQLEKLGEVSVKLSDEAMTQKKLMFRKVDSSFRDLGLFEIEKPSDRTS